MKNSRNKIHDFYSVNESLSYSINTHLNLLKNWINHFECFFKSGTTNILKNTIMLNIAINGETINEDNLLNSSENYVVVGSPGSGKTVLIKRLIFKMLIREQGKEFGVPILIKARELFKGSILDEIQKILGIERLTRSEVINLLNKNKITIFIDGLDEVNTEDIDIFIDELNKLHESSDHYRLITTSREEYDFAKCNYCEMLPLNQHQLHDLITLKLPEQQIHEFLNELSHLNIQRNPLIISIFISTYIRYGNLPLKTTNIYRQYIYLCLQEWDSMRMIVRRSIFSSLSVEQKFNILSFIAYYLLYHSQVISYSEDEILLAISKLPIKLNFSSKQRGLLLDDIVRNTGLIINKSSDRYEFIHKGIQEYCAAEYLIRLPNINFQDVLIRMPSVLALCVLISSNPFDYYTVVLNTINIKKELELSLISFLTSLFTQVGKNEIDFFINFNIHKEEKINSENLLFDEIIKTSYIKANLK
jgi:hypothetical protein